MAEMIEKSLRSEKVFDGVLLKVFRDEVKLSDGSNSVREWIDHPGAAAVVPLLADGSTLLVRQFRFPPRGLFLEVPAGKMDREGEKPMDLAARELAEETGSRAGSFTFLGAFYPCIGYSNEQIHVFLAEEITRGPAHLDEGEMVEVVSMSFDNAVDLAQKGRLKDMKTVAALTLADAYVRRRSSPHE